MNRIPPDIMQFLVEFININESGVNWRTTRSWQEWVDRHPAFLRPLFGGRADARQVEDFAADMRAAGKTPEDMRKLAALLAIPELDRTRDHLVDSGLVRAEVVDRLDNDEFALLASDKGVRAVARGFIAAAQIRHLDSMLAVYLAGVKIATRYQTMPAGYYRDTVLPLVERMIRAGADVNASYKSGKTALHMAGFAPLMEVLIASGARVDARDEQGRTPLHMAADASCTLALVRAGARVECEDMHGSHALHRAKSRDQTAALIKAGADVRVRNAKGRTPLHEAVEPAQATLLKLAGADPLAVDNAGNLPVNWKKLQAMGWKSFSRGRPPG
ncbi:ankyrin repeat domain-containing protein [Paraburkholderia graminis]|uniref:Ankyrin n=1 Tax=Paraburkholderia graminis TaxID=60548 RepID=A0ABD5CUH1_9BURK|nr:ankyrin repeat domain-containing protein [Paraburkholderia graminis]MDR6208109.1 hypothetical protein [Paraburkholderia graminis]